MYLLLFPNLKRTNYMQLQLTCFPPHKGCQLFWKTDKWKQISSSSLKQVNLITA